MAKKLQQKKLMQPGQEYNFKPNSGRLFSFTGYQICIICDKNEVKKELGTGFLFLRRDWIITAAHVVQIDGENRSGLYANFINNIGKNIVSLRVEAIHKELDIALLKIIDEENPCTQPLFPGYIDLSVSIGIVLCGYNPSSKNISIDLIPDVVLQHRERTDTEIILEFKYAHIQGGFSGGPVFGNGGVVLGILFNLFTLENEPDKKFARATSIQNVMKAMKIDYDSEIFIPKL